MTPDIPTEATAAFSLARDVFETRLLAVYLHGSAVSGGLRHQSDVDLLVVIDAPMTAAMRDRLLVGLLRISGRYPIPPGGLRCIELMVFLASELAAPAFPARCEFLYGEWLRDDFAAGQTPQPVADPKNTLLLAQARQAAHPLFGPALSHFLPAIPADDVRGAMRQGLPALLGNLAGDERNVLLTLARMWHTAETGAFVSKDAAATWAMARLPAPAAAVLAEARDAYLGQGSDDWTGRQDAAMQTADELHRRVTAALA